MSETPRLNLPLLAAGQLSKEIVHNLALERVDMMVQPVVSSGPSTNPPDGGQVGDYVLVAAGGEGDFSGHDNALAMQGLGGWIFATPFEGMAAYLKSEGKIYRFRDGSWDAESMVSRLIDVNGEQVVGEQQPAIAAPVGGTAIDVEAKATLGQIIECLSVHGLIAQS